MPFSRAALRDIIHVEEFRGVGGDASDLACVQAAINYMRTETLSNNFRKYFITGANQGSYLINGNGLDATAITSYHGWGIRDITFDIQCTDKVALDLSGSRYGQFLNVNGFGHGTNTPSAGILLSRITGNAAISDHRFHHCSWRGSFKKGVFINRASEVGKLDKCYFQNSFSFVDATSPGYVAIWDGAGIVPITSHWQTVATGEQAFNLTRISNCSFVKTAGATGDCVFLSRFVRWVADDCYFVSDTGRHYCIYLSGPERRFVSNSHHEGTTPTYMVYLTGPAAAAETISGFTLRDHSSQAQSGVFEVDPAIGTTVIDDAVIEIDNWEAGSVTSGLASTPAKLTFNRPAILLPKWTDLGNIEAYVGGLAQTARWLASKDTTGSIVGRSHKKISRLLGTAIGDLTANGGLAAAFNGTTSQTAAASAGKASGSTGYIGKTFAQPKIFGKIVAYGSNNSGFVTTVDTSTTLDVYGKVGAAPASGTDGTVIGTITFTDTTNESAGRTIVSTDLVTPWDHIWVNMTGTAAQMRMAQLVIYEWV